MTTNEACEKFGLEKKELYKRIKAGMIPGVVKKGRMFVIPDKTPFIPSEQEIRTFLLQILKFKNNPSYVFSRRLCQTDKALKDVLHYLYCRGFVGEDVSVTDPSDALNQIKLTDAGFEHRSYELTEKDGDPFKCSYKFKFWPITYPKLRNLNIG